MRDPLPTHHATPTTKAARVLPFRFLLSYPVELMLGRLSRGDALLLLAAQWGYVAAAYFLVTTVWRAGMKRFGAYGG